MACSGSWVGLGVDAGSPIKLKIKSSSGQLIDVTTDPTLVGELDAEDAWMLKLFD